VLTRFAPTPSGYLHLGNAVNALLVSRLAGQSEGRVALRIDDIDTARARGAYVDDIRGLLDWLGIDVAASWSQSDRLDRYREVSDSASGLLTYACGCSRRELTGPATGGCPGGCRAAGLTLSPGRTALRVVVPEGTEVEVDGVSVRLDLVMGDFVVWRRDDLPAYQLASIVDDVDLGVTHIVRGVDLLESTAAQRFLARGLGLNPFADMTILHHGLITDTDGTKLSKSQVTSGQPLPRTDEVRTLISEVADELGASLGITG
jgi:glutamyl-tRNA synthetase